MFCIDLSNIFFVDSTEVIFRPVSDSFIINSKLIDFPLMMFLYSVHLGPLPLSKLESVRERSSCLQILKGLFFLLSGSAYLNRLEVD